MKTVLITGASSGIGRATAVRLAKEGYKLILCARRKEKLELLKKELGADIIVLDVCDISAIEKAFKNLPDIDILINNAGLGRGLVPLQEGNIQDWEEMIDTNIKGLLYVTRTLLPKMVERNSGHIVNIGSMAGHETYPKGNVYCATKFAVRSLSEAMRLDLFGKDIRVSLISPGIVETEFSEVRFRGDKERAKVPYQGMKPLTAQDIADAIYYCISAPIHVNISEIMLRPTAQASATMVHRLHLSTPG